MYPQILGSGRETTEALLGTELIDSYHTRGAGRVEAGTLVRGVLGHVNLYGHGVADRCGARFPVGEHSELAA